MLPLFSSKLSHHHLRLHFGAFYKHQNIQICFANVIYKYFSNLIYSTSKIKMAAENNSEKYGKDEDKDSTSAETPLSVESIRQFLADKLSLFSSPNETDGESSTKKVIEDVTFNGVMKHWKKNGFKKIVTMVGAGISTSAGIPDFRSPGSGLYHNLEAYNLPYPTAIFEMSYFRDNPKPFFVLAKELYPGLFKPTPCHYFVRLLEEKGLLVRHYTQNIDTLERIAGISDEKLVEAHGTFYTNHCLQCKKLFSMEWMKDQIFADVIPICDGCGGVVKPDIVFFGENLPDKFYEAPKIDFKDCDLLIIMGTSLEVQPFASLINKCGYKCIRLLINREKVGQQDDTLSSWIFYGKGLAYDQPDNRRDVAWIGNCDDGVFAIADALDWGKELRDLIIREHRKLIEDKTDFCKCPLCKPLEKGPCADKTPSETPSVTTTSRTDDGSTTSTDKS